MLGSDSVDATGCEWPCLFGVSQVFCFGSARPSCCTWESPSPVNHTAPCKRRRPPHSHPFPTRHSSLGVDPFAPGPRPHAKTFETPSRRLPLKLSKLSIDDFVIRCRGMWEGARSKIASVFYPAATIVNMTSIRKCRGKIAGPNGSSSTNVAARPITPPITIALLCR